MARHRAGPAAAVTTVRHAPAWAALGVLAALASAAAGLLIPRQVGAAVGTLSSGADAGSITSLALLVAGAALASVLSTLAIGTYAARVTAVLRAELARCMIAAPSPADGTADLVTRLLVDARQPAAALPMAISMAVSGASLVAGLVLLALIDWWLLVGLLAGLVSLTVLLRRFVSDTTPLIVAYRKAQAEVGQRLLNAQRGAVTIRAYGTWLAELKRVVVPLRSVRAHGDALWSAQRRLAWRTSTFVPGMQLVTVAVGGWSLSQGRIDVGQFAAALGYTLVVLGCLDGIESAAGYNAVRAARGRLTTVLRQRPANLDRDLSPGPRPAGSGPIDVVLKNVTVRGSNGELILDAVSASIPAGSLAAITGRSGSGRSTLAAVISGRIAPTSGQVYLGGRSSAGLEGSEHRRLVTLGFARPALLGDTIGGLIRLGSEADLDAVRSASAQAHLAHVVDALPLGFDTPLADLELSGGELQRLSIAQALARDSRVLVLDDATASLDTATEREVLSALLAARVERTCVIVTNRAAAVSRADMVLTLDRGRIVEPARLEVAR